MNNVDSRRWLGFELNILRRLKFSTIAIPFAGQPDLGWYLKFWGKEIYSNDLCQSASSIARAFVENGTENLSPDDIDLLLDAVDTPTLPLLNPALSRYWSEADAVWFDNLRQNIDRLGSPCRQALAISHGLQVGDYARSFNQQTERLKRPLSEVFRHFWQRQRRIVDNRRSNQSFNLEATDFIRSRSADLMFVRFPAPQGLAGWQRRNDEWKEVWVRRDAGEWARLVSGQHGKPGDTFRSKEGYLQMMTGFLENSRHIPLWAISHTEDGFLSTGELAERVAKVRKVEAIYHKDFSEVVGGRNTYILIAR